MLGDNSSVAVDAGVGGCGSCGCEAIIRVVLKNGAFHEDVGYGCATNMPTDVEATEKALKSAVSDATKRALRVFGDRLGNCLTDKQFIADVQSGLYNSTATATATTAPTLGSAAATTAAATTTSVTTATMATATATTATTATTAAAAAAATMMPLTSGTALPPPLFPTGGTK